LAVPRWEHSESTSSMKIIEGAMSRAISNRMRTWGLGQGLEVRQVGHWKGTAERGSRVQDTKNNNRRNRSLTSLPIAHHALALAAVLGRERGGGDIEEGA
jgi:hypothetical protein